MPVSAFMQCPNDKALDDNKGQVVILLMIVLCHGNLPVIENPGVFFVNIYECCMILFKLPAGCLED